MLPKWKQTFIKQLIYSYKKAPYFEDVFEIIKQTIEAKVSNIAELNYIGIVKTLKHLNIEKDIKFSSKEHAHTRGLEKADRLITITKLEKADTYINPTGGKELYTKEYFKENGIALYFIENKLPQYSQFTDEFISGLSIIDILMFNDKNKVKEMLNQFTLT
jgi:hypothetical protein